MPTIEGTHAHINSDAQWITALSQHEIVKYAAIQLVKSERIGRNREEQEVAITYKDGTHRVVEDPARHAEFQDLVLEAVRAVVMRAQRWSAAGVRTADGWDKQVQALCTPTVPFLRVLSEAVRDRVMDLYPAEATS